MAEEESPLDERTEDEWEKDTGGSGDAHTEGLAVLLVEAVDVAVVLGMESGTLAGHVSGGRLDV